MVIAELQVPIGEITYPAYQNNGPMNPFFDSSSLMNTLNGASQYGAAVAGTAAAVATQAATQAVAQAAAAGQAALADMTGNPLALLPGKYGDWVRSGRYDYPVGGSDIDFFHNRLCFGEPCKYDPENTGDYSMEWLRRASPMHDYPYPPVFHKMQLELQRPDREYSLIPYQDVGKGGRIVYRHNVIVNPMGSLVDRVTRAAIADVSILVTIPSLRNTVIKDFIY